MKPLFKIGFRRALYRMVGCLSWKLKVQNCRFPFGNGSPTLFINGYRIRLSMELPLVSRP